MKIVAVSQRVDTELKLNETRDALDQNINSFLLACGLTPVPVPNVLIDEVIRTGLNCNLTKFINKIEPYGIILSGGNNIGKERLRDQTETWMLDYAEKKCLPVLGICRGTQMMAHRSGGCLKSITGHCKSRHRIHGEISGTVNSYHDFSLLECPENFKVIAWSDDNAIEAIQHVAFPWKGWMWHPEREDPFNSANIERLRKLFGEDNYHRNG